MRVTIFGATGRTGQQVVTQALARGHQVTAYVRTPSKLTPSGDRFTVVQGEMDEPEKISQAIDGAGAVISTLGPSSNHPGQPLTEGMENMVAAMKAHNVRRLIVTTGAGVVDPNDDPPLIGRIIGLALRLFSGNVLADSVGMATVVRQSGLDWTIARAPRLNDNPGGGQLKVGYAGKGPGIQLSRADFARFILDQLESEAWVQKAPMVSN
jgi:putative NADH-flavin reductase